MAVKQSLMVWCLVVAGPLLRDETHSNATTHPTNDSESRKTPTLVFVSSDRNLPGGLSEETGSASRIRNGTKQTPPLAGQFVFSLVHGPRCRPRNCLYSAATSVSRRGRKLEDLVKDEIAAQPDRWRSGRSSSLSRTPTRLIHRHGRRSADSRIGRPRCGVLCMKDGAETEHAEAPRPSASSDMHLRPSFKHHCFQWLDDTPQKLREASHGRC